MSVALLHSKKTGSSRFARVLHAKRSACSKGPLCRGTQSHQRKVRELQSYKRPGVTIILFSQGSRASILARSLLLSLNTPALSNRQRQQSISLPVTLKSDSSHHRRSQISLRLQNNLRTFTRGHSDTDFMPLAEILTLWRFWHPLEARIPSGEYQTPSGAIVGLDPLWSRSLPPEGELDSPARAVGVLVLQTDKRIHPREL